MLRLSVSTEEYLMLGDQIKIVFFGREQPPYADHDRCAQRCEYREKHGS